MTPPGNSDCETTCIDGWWRWRTRSTLKAVLERLAPGALNLILTDWRIWAHPAQRPPPGPWTTWLFLGGRGAGKTRAGAEWLSRRAVAGARLALVGPTLHDVREVMIEGPSGLRAIASGRRRPVYESSRRRLVWPNGAVAYAFSADDPESLRGPQFHAAWCDEFCAWPKPDETLALLRMGLRLGDDPRLAVTTTPRATRALKALIAEPDTATTRAPTEANRRNLSPNFLHGLTRLYGGTRLAAQELEGRILGAEGALWTEAVLSGCRAPRPTLLDRIVVGLDPPATAHGDACGLVVVGRRGATAYVLADRTVAGVRPEKWARIAAEVVEEFAADRVIAETNQGGQMVEDLLKIAGCRAPVRPVFATRSKRVRAEPVAALYEQGRVRRCARMPELEDELMRLGLDDGPSPDRADALVWAVSQLLLEQTPEPRLRAL